MKITQSHEINTDSIHIEAESNTTQAHESSPAGLAALGVNVPSLAFQILNFIILFIILQKFLFKPVIAVLEERKKKIEESLAHAQEIAEQKNAWDETQRKLKQKTIEESQALIAQAKKTATHSKEEILKETKAQQAKLIENAKKEIDAAQSQAVSQAKKELAELIVTATTKVLSKTMTPDLQKKIVTESTKE